MFTLYGEDVVRSVLDRKKPSRLRLTGPVFVLLLISLFLPVTVHASPAALDEGSKSCMNCHGTAGMTMTLGDRSTVSIYVDEKGFRSSVHGSLGCGGCHGDVSLDIHPSAKYSTKKQLFNHLTKTCRNCHGDGQLKADPLHRRVVVRENAPPCSDCHQAHRIQKRSLRKAGSDISQYCLTCHTRELSRSISGERISLKLDRGWISGSVHRKHECTDCHTGHSREFHPAPGKFANIRALSLAAAETCKRCHLNKAVQFSDSIHAVLGRQGDQNAPVCTDCHGAHQVGPPALADTLDGVPCKKCHQAEFTSYRTSVHGVRKGSGTGNPPLCAGCHQSHGVKPAAPSRSPREWCVSCHPALPESHQQWLPNPRAHLEMVACTACHVPIDRKRSIYLRLTDEGTGKVLNDADLRKILDARGISSGKIAPKDLWEMFGNLNQGRVTTVAVAISMSDPVTAHDIVPKTAALKQCDRCHSIDAAFFETVAVATAGPDGKEVLHGADPAILNSAYGVVLLKRFYVMSGTRITAMDYLGLAVILGGIAVPVLHGAARVLTARLRRERGERRK